MKALFITTNTPDCSNHVAAWESAYGPAERYIFHLKGISVDHKILEVVQHAAPDVIFYIGPFQGLSAPSVKTHKALREIAPTINLCSDAADKPWHGPLELYRHHGCFDLQASLDGAKPNGIDVATLTPVDPRPFDVDLKRNIRCGFSGSKGRWNARSEVIKSLIWFGGLIPREDGDELDHGISYRDHAKFLKRCRMTINVSNTGSGRLHHIKGRVLEAGYAGCALLESEGSPIAAWFPEDCYQLYRDPPHAADLIKSLDDETIDRMASRLHEEVTTRYSAKTIYGEMLSHVDIAKPRAA